MQIITATSTNRARSSTEASVPQTDLGTGFRCRLSDERGMAMVLALMVSFVVLLISTTVVAQSLASLNGSGLDRRRALSVHAAEGGLDQLYNYFTSTTPANLSAGPFSVAVNTQPNPTSVTATVTYVNAAGISMTPPFSSTTYPSGVLVNSVASTGTGVTRKMQSYLTLTPRYAGFDQAIMSANGASFANNFTLNGMNGDDGDVYVLNGNLAISNSSTVHGNLFAPTGTVSLSGNSMVYGSVWANGAVATSNPNIVTRDVTSSTASVTIGGQVQGNVRAGGTVTGAANVAGTVLQNSPQGPPPTQVFPTIGYDQPSWVAAGFTNIQTFTDCAAARDYVEGSWTGNTVIRITASCTYNNGNNATVSLNGDLAIVTEGGLTFSQKSDWNGITSTRRVFFVSTAPTPSCTGSKNITVGNNTSFNSLTQVFFYTPCAVSMNNSNAFAGQVMGGTVAVGNLFSMSFHPVLVPGAASISGFDENIAYIREVI
jgi:hypothetical protein